MPGALQSGLAERAVLSLATDSVHEHQLASAVPTSPALAPAGPAALACSSTAKLALLTASEGLVQQGL